VVVVVVVFEWTAHSEMLGEEMVWPSVER